MSTRTRQPASSITGLRGGLGRNLLTAFLLLAIMPLGLNAWLVVDRTNQEMYRDTQDRLSAIVTLKTAQIDGWLAHQEQNLAQVSARLAATPATTTLFYSQPGTQAHAAAAAEIRTLLTTNLSQNSFQAFHLARPDDSSETLLAIPSSHSTASPQEIRRTVPIPGPDGQPAGLLIGYLSPAPLNSLVVQTSELGSSGRAYLVTRSNQRLWPASTLSKPLHSPGIEAALSGIRGSALYTGYDDQPVVGAYDWLPSLELAIIVEQPQSVAFAPAEDLAALLIANTLLMALLTTLLAAVIIRRITRPIVSLTMRAVQIADGDFWQTVPEDRRDEIGILAQAFNIMTAELCQLYDNLQGIVTERTRQVREANRQLQHHAMRLTLSAEIGRITTAILDLNTLLDQAAKLIRDSYELYYVGIFLLEETGQHAILHSSAGQGIKDQIIPTHCPAGDETPIGRAIANGEPYLIRLAPTYAELAIPLRTNQQVLGVLDLWSDNPDAFSTSDIRVLQSLGDQISVAIVNARTYTQEQETTYKLRQLEHLRVQSFGSISQELATSLNSIIGFSRLILKGVDGPLTDLQRKDLTAIHQSGHHLLSMMDNVLDLVELERGTLTLDRHELDLASLIANILSTTQTQPPEQAISVRGLIAPDLPTVLGDEGRLRQVLIHLIAEVAELSEVVVISAYPSKGPEAGVLLRVIGQSEHATLPLPKPTDTANNVVWDEDGASLGLALSKRLVELHGGRLWAQPAPKGNRVYALLLPTAVAPAEPTPCEPGNEPPHHTHAQTQDSDTRLTSNGPPPQIKGTSDKES